jgi:urease gamma subunit
MANEVKPIPETGFNLSSMNGILNTILSAFSVPEQPVTPLPPPLIMFGAKLRPGLSAQSIAAEIISKQSESGRVVGDVFADGPNVEEAMEVIRVQEIVKALLNEAKIEVVIPPGVQILTVGPGNLGGAVISQGATTSMGIGNGVIR